jgi:hypothetical protein
MGTERDRARLYLQGGHTKAGAMLVDIIAGTLLGCLLAGVALLPSLKW